MKLNIFHYRVLYAMSYLTAENEDWLFTFSAIHQSTQGIAKISDTRRIVRFLRKHKLVDYSICMQEDGYYMAGSGHRINSAGMAALKEAIHSGRFNP